MKQGLEEMFYFTTIKTLIITIKTFLLLNHLNIPQPG